MHAKNLILIAFLLMSNYPPLTPVFARDQQTGVFGEGVSPVSTSETRVLSSFNGNSLTVNSVAQLLQAVQNPNLAVIQELPAIALSIKPGGRVDTIRIDGGLKTHSPQILPLEQLGSIWNLVVAGGCSQDDTNK